MIAPKPRSANTNSLISSFNDEAKSRSSPGKGSRPVKHRQGKLPNLHLKSNLDKKKSHIHVSCILYPVRVRVMSTESGWAICLVMIDHERQPLSLNESMACPSANYGYMLQGREFRMMTIFVNAFFHRSKAEPGDDFQSAAGE